MRKNLLTRIIIIVCALILLLFDSNLAQERIAWIKTIADISGTKPMKISEPTSRVRIKREFSGKWFNAGPDSNLFYRDKILLEKLIRVLIQIKRKDQKGRTVFASDSLQSLKRQALYEIREHPELLGAIEIFIANGSLALDWAYGKLSVIASGIRANLDGTKALFYVDSTGTTGFVYLQSGSLSFHDYPEIKVRPKDVFRLTKDQKPSIRDVPIVGVLELNKFLEYNSSKIWSQIKPWWQKPTFYIPAATVGVVTGLLFIPNGNGDEELPRPPRPPNNP